MVRVESFAEDLPDWIEENAEARNLFAASGYLPVEIVREGRAEKERDANEVALHAKPIFREGREQHDDEQRHDEDARQRQCVRKIEHVPPLLSLFYVN